MFICASSKAGNPFKDVSVQSYQEKKISDLAAVTACYANVPVDAVEGWPIITWNDLAKLFIKWQV